MIILLSCLGSFAAGVAIGILMTKIMLDKWNQVWYNWECKHHSRADARNSYEVGSRLEIEYLRVMKLLNIPHSKCGGVSLVGWSPTTQTMLLMGWRLKPISISGVAQSAELYSVNGYCCWIPLVVGSSPTARFIKSICAWTLRLVLIKFY